MYIVGTARAFPGHYHSQQALTEQLAKMWRTTPYNPARLQALHEHANVGGRYTALSLAELAQLDTFTKSNQAYVRVGGPLAAEVAQAALHDAGIEADAVDHLFFVSVTGLGVPSLDAHICNALGLRDDVKRTPIFGLGCVAGAAGLARASDYLLGRPNETALLVSVELCSLTYQRTDVSVSGLVASGLFGDGSAAAVLQGAQAAQPGSGPRPAIVASRSVFFRDTERMLGWDITSDGFRVVLSGQLPALLGSRLQRDVDAFLAAHGVRRDALASVICHPGGPKIMQVIEQELTLSPSALRFTRQSLHDYGNVSSTSVLLVLEDTMQKAPGKPGSHSLLMAFGPGFCCELVLLRW